ncbi:MAG: tyrosine-protein phosphatase [Candidatus Gastranaerophilales bacterium]|nr:tyrosine-protein phosphatase [Candidatus Gastranaerophilales bacterium]MCM1073324.1 tyrosine-protein phosphatase [Bacteroides sp.]
MLRILPIFKGKPNNYARIDDVVSRSAQPKEEDFIWLKSQGVTDIINFRTMIEPAQTFDEKNVVENLGMKYHNIPTITPKPTEEKVAEFLDIVEGVQKQGGKAHIHCKAGADRTGMYAFIYKGVKGIGSMIDNEREWLAFGHNNKRFPKLINWAKGLKILQDRLR